MPAQRLFVGDPVISSRPFPCARGGAFHFRPVTPQQRDIVLQHQKLVHLEAARGRLFGAGGKLYATFSTGTTNFKDVNTRVMPDRLYQIDPATGKTILISPTASAWMPLLT